MERSSAHPSRTAALALLKRAGLPISDVTDALVEGFFFAGEPDAPFGIVGLEISPPHALLRSLVVEAEARSGGTGSRLLAHAEDHAGACGVRTIYLLTTTAEVFFAARGYAVCDRSEAPAFIRSSTEFASLCPASAAFMSKHLEELLR